MHFLRLIRPFNLAIVALTMYGMGYYFEFMYAEANKEASEQFGFFSLTFHLLVFSTLMIAAAGNIINDYFDIKADRINKPHRLIIGKYIKRRVAIVSHWGLNFTAFFIAVYLSWVLNSFWYMFIHLLSINILWFYSMKGKRLFLTGNILIAGLTATVPILVGFYFNQLYDTSWDGAIPGMIFNYPLLSQCRENYPLILSFILAAFAFILNLAREIVKDMEDVEGDKKLPARTLPIVLGYHKSKWIVAFILLGTVIGSLIFWILTEHIFFVQVLPIVVSALLIVIVYLLLPKATEKEDFKRINHLIKLAMVAGLLLPMYWLLLIYYG